MQDDLIERLRDAGFVLVSPGMRKLANDAAARIAALEAEKTGLSVELDRAKHDLTVTGAQYQALIAENARLREALEQFLSLIEYQYCGSREAMNALQEADNSARAALGEKQ